MVRELEDIGAQHFTLPVKSKNPITLWKNAGLLSELIRAQNVDIIHARSRAPAWSSLFAARRTICQTFSVPRPVPGRPASIRRRIRNRAASAP